jgi:hypothetical protein
MINLESLVSIISVAYQNKYITSVFCNRMRVLKGGFERWRWNCHSLILCFILVLLDEITYMLYHTY